MNRLAQFSLVSLVMAGNAWAQAPPGLTPVDDHRGAELADARFEAGRHTVRLDGSRLASGTYFVRAVMRAEGGGLSSEARVLTQRLTLLK